MKISIFHNLEPGGGLNYLIETTRYLHKTNQVDIYSFKNNLPAKIYDNYFQIKLSKTNNIFSHIVQILFELRQKNRLISNLIKQGNYQLNIIYPCLLTQAPYLLNYLDPQKTIYIFNEPKREFYEPTSYNYFSLSSTIKRFLRLFIKYIDLHNCNSAKHIISNSKYSSGILRKIYNKKSTVIYPGLKFIKPKKIKIQNTKKIISIGVLSKIKGHDFSIKQLSGICSELTIIGRTSNEASYLHDLAKKNNIKLNIISTENDKIKKKILKEHTIYLSNSIKEPFGIATLEACEEGLFVIGKKEGGTKEIIHNGVNGILYPSSLKKARNTLKSIINKKTLSINKITKIDWPHTTDKILKYYRYKIKHEPTE